MFTRGAFIAAASASAARNVGLDLQAQERFTGDAVRADLAAIWSTLLDVGADPFRTSTRSDVEKCYRSARAGVTAEMTLPEAWLAIAPVLGALNDGHVGLGFPEPLNTRVFQFPLRFALAQNDDALVLTGDRTATIPPGSRILSINGITAERYRCATLRAFGAQTRTLHRERVTMAGAWTSLALFGAGPLYRVRWSTPAGVRGNAEISATPPPAASGRMRSSADPYTYRTLQEGTVGVIDYRSCEDLPRFKAFLAATFQSIKSSPIRALVIDIRGNGGGNSQLNDVLWTYVSKKPFKQFGGVVVKACDRLKREYGHDKYVDLYGNQAWAAPDGTIIRDGMDPDADLIVPGPLALRFSGPVYLLISAQTFSSAMSCALAAKDYGLATIVGQETGEPVNSTGEIYTETAPQTGLRAFLTTKVFLSPKPHPEGQGVVPDVSVAINTLSDSERDPVLERVLAMIGANAS